MIDDVIIIIIKCTDNLTICGFSLKIKAKYMTNTDFYDWRNATKDIDEAVRKAWLSLKE